MFFFSVGFVGAIRERVQKQLSFLIAISGAAEDNTRVSRSSSVCVCVCVCDFICVTSWRNTFTFIVFFLSVLSAG